MSAIIDHVGISVADFGRSRDFYVATLGTLGVKMLVEFTHNGTSHAGFGIERPTFWIGDAKKLRGEAHIAFAARSHSEVKAFHIVALATGGRDNGGPGLRTQYHPDYFGAFVFDPDGNNIEAVCHAAE